MTSFHILNNRIYPPTDTEVQDPERYKALVEHLPPEVKKAIDVYHPKVTSFEKNFEKFKDTSTFFETTRIDKISRVYILAYKMRKISFEELASAHMLLGSIDEMYLKCKSFFNCHTSYAVENSYSHNSFFSASSPPYSWMRFGYQSSSRKPGITEEFEKLDYQLLPAFFHIFDEEWRQFTELMEDPAVPDKEKLFHGLFPVEIGTWSGIYEKIKSVLKCFHPVKFYSPPINKGYKPTFKKITIVPSYTMMQAFLKVKAATNNRKPVELVPVFGRLGYNKLGEYKRKAKMPMGLLCPTPQYGFISKKPVDVKYLKNDLYNKHMQIIDGWGCGGAYSMLIHDTYHALREQEMCELHVNARFRLVDIIDRYGQTISHDKEAEPYKEMRKLRNKIVDGELFFGVKKVNTLFRSRPYITEPFGRIFDSEYMIWGRELELLALTDMVINKQIWKEQYQINIDVGLPEKTQDSLKALKVLFADSKTPKDVLPLFKIYSREINPLLVIAEPRIVLENSIIYALECEHAWIKESRVKLLKAEHALFQNCDNPQHDLKFIGESIAFKNCQMGKIEAECERTDLANTTFTHLAGNVIYLITPMYTFENITCKALWVNAANHKELTFINCEVKCLIMHFDTKPNIEELCFNIRNSSITELNVAFENENGDALTAQIQLQFQ